MSMTTSTSAYRALLRELRKSAVNKGKVPPTLRTHFRTLVTRYGTDEQARSDFRYDMENTVLFVKSQREHKILLDRYNPLFDLTAEERIEATARRVGLNMPLMPEEQGKEPKE
ncbi:hypothetical protein BD626DRAFT_480658 [Schizophyllum amplum]|uniref:Uncharacterized protein n=1 Tax=Schizophyllum amplum TaxID=97359 RepID=A0A550CTE2_9AGAR|nr:hypothetical protein BD626DRAFT_480658 [Auriculariopsis ampla]